jgi:hypothetical protein
MEFKARDQTWSSSFWFLARGGTTSDAYAAIEFGDGFQRCARSRVSPILSDMAKLPTVGSEMVPAENGTALNETLCCDLKGFHTAKKGPVGVSGQLALRGPLPC